MALDFTNIPRNSAVNKLMREITRLSYKQLLAKNGITGSRAKQMIAEHKQQIKNENKSQNKAFNSPNSNDIKTLQKQINKGAKELDDLADAFTSNSKSSANSLKGLQSNNPESMSNMSSNPDGI